MDPQLWGSLGEELQERMVSFLAVPDLCRLRAVCKRWDGLISTPEFPTLCLQNANKKGPGYIVGRLVKTSDFENATFFGWAVLDLEDLRWYMIEREVTRVHVDQGRGSKFTGHVASDGGLVVEFLPYVAAYDGAVITIYNPLMEEKIMQLPNLPNHFKLLCSCAILSVVVDCAHDTFKVFFVDFGDYDSDQENDSDSDDEISSGMTMPIFDSTTCEWRISTARLPWRGTLDGKTLKRHCCSVKFQGLLYVVFTFLVYPTGPKDPVTSYWLCSYNIEKDLWEDTGVRIQDMMVYNSPPQLVVCDDRIFLLSQSIETSGSPRHLPVVLEEILLAKRDHSFVFETTRKLVEETSGVPEEDYMRASGYSKSLIFTSRTSVVEYNLVDNSWHRLPPNPFPNPVQSLYQGNIDIWYGETMNLRLPNGWRGNVVETAPPRLIEDAGDRMWNAGWRITYGEAADENIHVRHLRSSTHVR